MHGDGSNGEGIDVEPRGGTTVVRAYGEMDIDRAQDFREVLLAVLSAEPRPGTVVVDLQGLSFCDSSGLNALLNARTVAAEGGQSFSLAAPGQQVLRLMEITGVTALFTIEPVPPS
ncbi:STAS domain-containing protein [Streptomyces sp. NRRL S-87]|uniref:STAS domain-containing protein n=1 Tax=Streptomyces sp. NRRL S-87 TaxID=1463920 RepID=UPI000562BCDC|nr:STAS domain-containing protein [Streptomyces sp. NRRL S-87]